MPVLGCRSNCWIFVGCWSETCPELSGFVRNLLWPCQCMLLSCPGFDAWGSGKQSDAQRHMNHQAGEDLLAHDACLLHAFTLTSHLG